LKSFRNYAFQKDFACEGGGQMSMKKARSARKGRDLELLVKRIKEHQSPDATICSPEYVPDKDTGQLREVDVGIRVSHNNESVFIAVECRDRGSVQAVEWIEQLICKKQSIGADVLVAVTSSRFSKPARIKALKHGVVLARMTLKLPEELADLASSYFITLRYLALRIISVDLKIPRHLNADLECYRYRHALIDQELTLDELAQVWTTPNLVRTIPRFVEDWNKAKFAKIEPVKINATVISGGQQYPITRARIGYELNYGELDLPLRAVQELTTLDVHSGDDAVSFAFGVGHEPQSEIIVDTQTGDLRWDILGKTFLNEGKVLIGAKLKANKPVIITTMRLDL
jgi:hypothetical protein